MTEKEIIQILKDNKEKGIVFAFLPDEVISFAIGNKLADEYFIPKNLILEILARHTDILNGVTDHC